MKNHLKRLYMPKFWHVERKGQKFITRPSPGPHKTDGCITVDFLLKEFLKSAKIRKEVKYILNNKKLLIDKKAVSDYKFSVGLMDVIDVVDSNEHYRIMLDENGHLKLIKIDKDDSNYKFCKIIGKNTLKGNKPQLNFIDGRNIIVDKDVYKVGDTIIFDFVSKKIKKHLRLEQGARVLLISGKHIGKIGTIEKINQYKGMRESTVIFKDKEGIYETLKDYCYIIDKGVRGENEKN
ncbi:30S ribosomal protein S4e [Candidatus Woesearchaeota archaeon]|nr:30S ribosomal protein S4e [Candidatus Woesearchaeota archaeon]